MAAEISITEDAENDIAHAYQWYERCRSGLGEQFVSCIDDRIEIISQMPELYEKVYKEFRRAIVRRFPYVIFYELSENMVTIYGVFHASRHPDTWKKRMLDF
ncbi:type II toxin-antitoxin system RelE/ParE family toxin [bacterium]|nr:type II toxin-antitoxin system RelE/ParE family toxin [bacterium]